MILILTTALGKCLPGLLGAIILKLQCAFVVQKHLKELINSNFQTAVPELPDLVEYAIPSP